MKSPIIIFAYILLLLNFGLSNSFAQNSDFQFTLEYEIVSTNQGYNIWYSNVEQQSWAYSFDSLDSFTVNLTDFSQDTRIDLTIGNLTRNNISDLESENALALGYYVVEDAFGFIANTSWSETTTALEKVDGLQLSVQEMLTSTLGTDIDLIHFTFSDSFQATELIYIKSNGILISASSSAGGYNLEIELLSINGDVNYFNDQKLRVEGKTDSDGINFSTTFLFTFPALILLRYKKFRQKD